MSSRTDHRRQINLAIAAITLSFAIPASPAHAGGPFDKLEELVDKVDRKVSETERRVERSERTKRRTGSLLDRLGMGKPDSDPRGDANIPGRDGSPNMYDPTGATTSGGAETTAFLQAMPVYPGAWQVPTTDPQVSVTFFTPDKGENVTAFYAALGREHGFQIHTISNPYPGVVLINAQEQGAVIATVPDGSGTRFFTDENAAFAAN